MLKKIFRKVTSLFSKKGPESLVREEEPESAVREEEPEPAVRERELELAARHRGPELAVREKKPKRQVVAMVPILSWRTIIAVVIGVIVGAGLGLSYWIISPSFDSFDQPGAEQEIGGLAGLLGMSQTDLYESRIYVQIVNPGSSYMSLRELQNKGEYYAAKANSLPFLDFLRREIDKQAPEYSHTADELDEILRIRFNLDEETSVINLESEFPAIEVKVTGTSSQEALFLAGLVPQAFKNYLITEEDDKQEQEYQNTIGEVESVKTALYEAEQELDACTPQDIANDPNYIALSAKVEALERELNDQAVELTALITSGDDTDTQQEYAKISQQANEVSAALAEAEQELKYLEEQEAGSDSNENATYIILDAKITALEIELDRLMTGWAEDTPIGTEKKMGLAEMITNGITTGTEYRERLEQIQTVSAALAEARREIAAIDNDSSGNLTMSRDYRLAQFKVDTLNAELSTLQERLNLLSSQSVNGNSQLDTQTAFDKVSVALAEAKEGLATLESQLGYTDLDYRIAQDKVNNLDNELANLTTKLSSMLTENVDSVEMTDYFVMGNPSIPIPVLPERVRARNVLMIGAIVGVGGAWVALNFRWIAKGMPSSSMAKPDELEEE